MSIPKMCIPTLQCSDGQEGRPWRVTVVCVALSRAFFETFKAFGQKSEPVSGTKLFKLSLR